MISKVDRKILELLQKDARMPITQIAKQVDMSENGVKYRLDKLEEKGVIKRFSLQIDPKKAGKNVMALFDIELEPRSVRETIPLMVNLDEFIKIYHITGEYPLKAIGLFESNKDLNKFIKDKLLMDFPIKDYKMNIVTEKYKDSIYYV